MIGLPRFWAIRVSMLWACRLPARVTPMLRTQCRATMAGWLKRTGRRMRTCSARPCCATWRRLHNGAPTRLEGIVRHRLDPLAARPAWRPGSANLPPAPWLAGTDFAALEDGDELARQEAAIDMDRGRAGLGPRARTVRQRGRRRALPGLREGLPRRGGDPFGRDPHCVPDGLDLTRSALAEEGDSWRRLRPGLSFPIAGRWRSLCACGLPVPVAAAGNVASTALCVTWIVPHWPVHKECGISPMIAGRSPAIRVRSHAIRAPPMGALDLGRKSWLRAEATMIAGRYGYADFLFRTSFDIILRFSAMVSRLCCSMPNLNDCSTKSM